MVFSKKNILIPIVAEKNILMLVDFFNCPNYTEIRRIMMNNLNWVQTSDLNLNLLTRESDDLTYEENINIIKHVFNFIKSYTCHYMVQVYSIALTYTCHYMVQVIIVLL
jgi:hypothetical protein